MKLLDSELCRIMPHLSPVKAAQFIAPLNAAMEEFGIALSSKRAASFLAQLAHESGEFRWFEELASGKAYEGRSDLGNNQPGDGPRYKGRGPIQLTGRENYRKAGRDLQLDLEKSPELAADPAIGFRIAGWYWRGHGCNELADLGDFKGVTKRINGGLNGLTQREVYHERAKAALHV